MQPCKLPPSPPPLQINTAVTAAVDHHLPSLEAAARDKVTRALQRQLRTILAASVDPGSCTCPRCKAAIVSAYHCIGRVAAICCTAWWSTTGALPDKPKLLPAGGLWNAPLWGDYAAAYLGWNDAALGRRSTEDAEPSEVRKGLLLGCGGRCCCSPFRTHARRRCARSSRRRSRTCTRCARSRATRVATCRRRPQPRRPREAAGEAAAARHPLWGPPRQ